VKGCLRYRRKRRLLGLGLAALGLVFVVGVRGTTIAEAFDGASIGRATPAVAAGRASRSLIAAGSAPESEAERAFARYERVVSSREPSGCPKQAHQHALWSAVAYSTSCDREPEGCDEALARAAIDRLLAAREWQTCSETLSPTCRARCRKADERRRFAWLEFPTLAWDFVAGSPSVTESDESAITSLLLRGAEDLWPPIEAGATNRAVSLAASFLRLARRFPDHERATAWTAYGLETWREVSENGGFSEDSGGYEAEVLWPALIQLSSEIASRSVAEDPSIDARRLFEQPGLTSMLERLFDHTAPIGFLPAYGHATGVGSAGYGQIWLFEEAARLLEAPRYAWSASRLRAFLSERIEGFDPRRAEYLALADRFPAAGTPEAAAPDPVREVVVHAAPEGAVRTEERLEAGETLVQTLPALSAPIARLAFEAIPATPDARLKIEVLDRPQSAEPLRRFEQIVDATGRLEIPASLAARDVPRILRLTAVGGDVNVTTVARSDTDAMPARIQSGGGVQNRALDMTIHGLVGRGSVVTSRPQVRRRPRWQWGTPRKPWAFTGAAVPDKLVLRSGFGVRDLWAMIDLIAGQNHDVPAVGGLVSLIDEGALLVTPAAHPYWDFEPDPRHSNALVVGEPGRAFDARPEVVEFEDTPRFTRAHVRWQGRNGIAKERRVLFVKNRLLWIRDRATAQSGSVPSVSVHWYAQGIERLREDTYSLSMNRPWSSGLPIRNPSRALWLAVLETVGVKTMHEHVEQLAPPQQCREREGDPKRTRGCRERPDMRVRSTRRVSGQTLDDAWIDTLLVPWSGSGGPEARVVVEVDRRFGAGRLVSLVMGAERWLLLDNPEGLRVEADDVSTDARVAIQRSVVGDSIGTASILVLREAMEFEGGNGGSVQRFPSRSSIETGPVPERITPTTAPGR